MESLGIFLRLMNLDANLHRSDTNIRLHLNGSYGISLKRYGVISNAFEHFSFQYLGYHSVVFVPLQKLLDPSTLEFTSIGKLEKTVHRLRSEHTDVMNFRSQLEACHQARTKMPKDEVAAFTQWLTRVESAYSSILVSQVPQQLKGW